MAFLGGDHPFMVAEARRYADVGARRHQAGVTAGQTVRFLPVDDSAGYSGRIPAAPIRAAPARVFEP